MSYPSILLASASPRRAQLLEQIGVPFAVLPSNADESVPEGVSPEEGAELVARRKAEAVASIAPKGEFAVVLGADTEVVLDGIALGKPQDADDARRMLRSLSGRTHEVVTGVALVWLDSGETESWRESSRVFFRELSDAEIERYVASGRPMDKAGAYGIQEDAAAFVSRIEGCYFNVVGLPLSRLASKLLRDSRA